MEDKLARCACGVQPRERRNALKLALGVVLGLDLVPRALAQGAEPRSMRPQPGDQLVYAGGTNQGQIISVADIQTDAPPVHAFPLEPRSRLIRDGSRLNKVLMVRSDPQSLNEETRSRTVEGIAAYSAICTHQGCEVIAWDAQTKSLWCPLVTTRNSTPGERSRRRRSRP